MNFKTILPLFFICLSTTTFAQKYAGFELCQKTSINKILNFLEKSGATNITQEQITYDWTSIGAKNYPIENGFAEVSVGVVNGILKGIFILDKDNKIGILNVMTKKYGEPHLLTIEGDKSPRTVFDEDRYRFKSKDPKIEITATSNSAGYDCKLLNKNTNQDKGLRKNDAGHSL